MSDNNKIAKEPDEQFLAFQKKAKAANLNEQTLLATDYLNLFNELVMTIEMIPDMPELLDDAKEWRPKTYQEHFNDSTFADKKLAIEAYEYVPTKYRKPFEATISTINQFVAMTLTQAEVTINEGNDDKLRLLMSDASRGIQRLMDMASANIHGSEQTLDQLAIDNLLNL